MDHLISAVRQMPDMPHHSPTPESPAGTDHMSNGGMNHAMSPFIFSGTTEFFVLFEGVFIKSTGAFVGALIVSFVFAILVTVLSQLAKIYENRALASSNSSAVSKLAAAILFGFRQSLHYFAMLIVMTMNIWLIVAVVAGHAVGWLIYGFALHKSMAGNFVNPDAALGDKAVGCDC